LVHLQRITFWDHPLQDFVKTIQTHTTALKPIDVKPIITWEMMAAISCDKEGTEIWIIGKAVYI
jgi:hypothetical protein